MNKVETIIFGKLVSVDQKALSTFRKKEKLLKTALELQKLGYSKELEDNVRKIRNINRKIERNGWHVRFL